MKNEKMIYKTRLLLLLALLTAFPPLSTDMYLPAIPLLQKTWQQPLAIVNLTLVGFFVSYCVFLLIYGPLSDRFGRRPLLLVGIGIFILASLLCALSNNVVSLTLFRCSRPMGRRLHRPLPWPSARMLTASMNGSESWPISALSWPWRQCWHLFSVAG